MTDFAKEDGDNREGPLEEPAYDHHSQNSQENAAELTSETVTSDHLNSSKSSTTSSKTNAHFTERLETLSLREWTPLTPLLRQIPPKAQKGLTTLELKLTAVGAVDEFIAVGTNVGLVYWYNRLTDVLDRLKTENTSIPISTVSLVSTVDFMLAAGNEEGLLTIFQIPKTQPVHGNDFERFINTSLRDNCTQGIQRFDVYGLHLCKITCLEWSSNGMKLFSGDVSGTVVLTELDFETGKVKSRPIVQEANEIVQLSYLRKYLLICSTLQSVIYSLETNSTCKVGTQDRKIQGKFGGIFRKNSFHDSLKLFSVRPGGRLWLADMSGMVEHTIKFKDLLLENNYSNISVIQPSFSALSAVQDFQIGYLHRIMSTLLVSFHKNVIYVLDPVNTRILAVCRELKGVLQLAVNPTTDEIFVLESEKNLIRLSATPDSFTTPSQSTEFLRNIPLKMMSTSIADFRMEMEQPLNFITSKIKNTSRYVPKINSTLINTLKQVIEADVNITDGETVIPLRAPDTPDIAVENYIPTNSSDSLAVADKFEHISHLPFDDVLLVPPRVKKKMDRRKPKRNTIFQSSGDTVSLSSSTYSINSDDENVAQSSRRMSAHSDINQQQSLKPEFQPAVFSMSHSQSWSVGEGEDQTDTQSEMLLSDLESKEEILARRLNWPELLPESRRSIVDLKIEMNAPHQKSEEASKVQDHESDHDQDGSSSVLTLREGKNSECEFGDTNGSSSLGNPAVVSSSDTLYNSAYSYEDKHGVSNSDIFEESIDIYTKYAPKEATDSIPSALSFGPPSTNSTSNSSSGYPMSLCTTSTSMLEPKIVETDESTLSISPRSTIDLVPIRDMVVEPSVDSGNSQWLSYAAPAPLQSVAACDKFVMCIDKRSCVYVSELDEISLRWVQTKWQANQISISFCASVLWRLHKGILYSLMDPDPKTSIIEGSEWSKICSNVISMCIQRHVGWIVKQDGSVFICSGLLTTAVVPDFENVPCSFQISRIVAEENKVWAVTQDGRVLFRNGVTEDKLRGTEWIEKYFESRLPFSAAVVALGPAGSLWIGDAQNNLYFVDGLNSRNYEGKPYHWKISLGNYLSCAEGVEGRHSSGGSSSGTSFSLNSLKNKLSDSLKPERIVTFLSQKAGPIVCGTDSAVWFSIVGTSTIFVNKAVIEGHRWVPMKVWRPLRVTTWINAMAGSIYLDHGFLWLLDPKGKLFYCNSNGGEAKSIDLPCSSPIMCVVPAPDTLWILNKEGVIYARDNVSTTNPIGHGWITIDLSSQERFLLTHVSCGSDVAWGCDAKGKVFMRVGSLKPPGSNDISPAWVPVDDDASISFKNCVFTKVYVGTNGSMVWALDSKNNIYVREAIFSDFPIGTRWLLVSGVEAVSLTLSEEAVYALSPKGEIFRRFGISNVNFVGEYWKKIPGPCDATVQVLTASLCDIIWAIDNSGQLVKHFYHKLNVKDNSTPLNKPKIVLDPEDKEWVFLESL